ncbi:uncharacterized protein LOC109537132 [Dendroctonus ponderosae]|uniref:uncharacterized protein LOC109537132 n=1 Tax=Dendroctonus ponderosae TaxID=77166 RepID=UPI0020363D66|nr:uncharacterized protein LOC109537132 [Dendroctonus ponderosae]
MSGGPRPPVPGLIPLAALSRRPGRPRRRPESIDVGAGSRCLESRAAAPGRRRHHRRRASAAAPVSKQSRSSSPALDRPPRVNPIFVWVRQEDTRIVDVKCEDYDKRNRILLTKTAHGWRAIPRTEMLAAPRGSAEEPLSSSSTSSSHGHHHRHHHKRRSRKSKSQQSTSVQCPETESASEPSWVTSESVNIESLLPSHTIQIKRIPSSEDLTKSVNNAPEQDFARTVPECSTPDKVCDVSPLENLLAVAELELKQHMQSGNWNPIPKDISKDTTGTTLQGHSVDDEINELLNTKSRDIEAELIDTGDKSQECSYNDDDEMSMNDILSRLEQSLQSPQGFGSEDVFDDDMLDHNCKFDKNFTLSDETSKTVRDQSEETDQIPESSNTYSVDAAKNYSENNAIDYHAEMYPSEATTSEILDPVESLQPPTPRQDEIRNEYLEDLQQAEHKEENLPDIHDSKSQEYEDKNSESSKDLPEDHAPLELEDEKPTHQPPETNFEPLEAEEITSEVAEAASSTTQEKDQLVSNDKELTDTAICLDLSLKNKPSDYGPTDLSIRKFDSSPKCQPPRPLSQNSEAIQSPQPSGIPAVPASPDIVTTSTSISKPRSVFLESLLATSLSKMAAAANAENVSRKSKEPLDLGQCRKSASPTVTCSEEIFTPSDAEPPLKKMKPDDITLKNLLDKDIETLEQNAKKTSQKDTFILPDTPRLLSLLKASSDTQDPLAEYKQLLLEIDIPNPLMVPKDVFPDLLQHPRREILKILSGHSSKNVSLDDILVVYKDKLLAAIKSNSSSTKKNSENIKPSHKQSGGNKNVEQNNNVNEKNFTGDNGNKKKTADNFNKNNSASPDNKNSLANDIDAANEAAFNPLFWTGCPNPFEAMNYSNHNEFIQALYAASSLPYMPGQLGEFHPSIQMMLGNKLAAPLGFPPVPHMGFNNPFELSMWQEAMMQANILKNKNPYENAPINPQPHRSNLPKKNQSQQNKYNARLANGHSKNISQSHQSQQQGMIHPAFSQTPLTNQSPWQNPYLAVGNFPQGSNSLSLDTTQFNPFSHKNNISPANKQSQQLSPPIMQKKTRESLMLSQYNDQEKRLHHQMMQEHQKIQQMQQQQKLIRQHQHQQLLHQQQQQMLAQNNGARHLPPHMTKKPNSLNSFHFPKECSSAEVQKQAGVSVPMDLSGAHSIQAKSKSVMAGSGKTNGMVSSSRNHMEDVPEVGSTTSSIEDMQDGHAQLWHPLFGSQNKGYSPWSLPSLAAMGE